MVMRRARRTSVIQYAVGYIRVSSEEQAKEDRFSLRAQRKEIQAYCERRGWTLHHDIYEDAGHSAKGSDITTRPAFKRMLTDVMGSEDRDGRRMPPTVRCDVIVTHTLDRYARNLVVALTTLADLHDHGIAYSSVTESDFDYSDPDRRLHLQILAMFAEYFSEKLSQHTSKGKKERAESGLYNGDVPYGYKNPDEGTNASGAGVYNASVPVRDPHEAEAVRKAFTWYATGQYSDYRVAQALNDAGYRMVSKRQPQGGPFKKDTITALLQNRFYLGEVRQPDGTYKAGKHEAIIDHDLFDRAQAVRHSKHHKGHASSPVRHAHTYVAAGIIHCASCGQLMRAQGAANRKPGYCDASKARGIPCTTRRKSIPEPDVEQALYIAVSGLRLPDDWRTMAVANLDAADDDETARIEVRRAALETKLDRLKGLVKEGIIDPAEYRADKAEIDTNLDALPVAKHVDVDLDRAAALLEDMRTLWDEANREERREIVHALFEGVWVDLDTRRDFQVQLKSTLSCLESVLPKHTIANGRTNSDDATCTSSGTDGIRTRDLLRDRQACWATTPRLQGIGKRPYAPKE